jgi:hypothetical protein
VRGEAETRVRDREDEEERRRERERVRRCIILELAKCVVFAWIWR